MSEVQATSVEQERPGPAKGTGAVRMVILLLIFGVALASLLYDYCVARPSIKKADQAIQRLLEDSGADPNGDGTVTEDEVQSVLLCKPTDVKPLSNGKIEVYSWRSGLPYRTYHLYVIYSGQKLPLLYAASANEEPTGDKLPPTATIPPPMTEEERKNFVPPRPSFLGAAGAESGDEKQTAEKNQDEPAADAGQDAGEAKVKEKTDKQPVSLDGSDL